MYLSFVLWKCGNMQMSLRFTHIYLKLEVWKLKLYEF